MKKFYLFGIAVCIISLSVFSQNVAINNTGNPADASAMLDVQSTNKGLLIPRIALTSTGDNATIASPAVSLLIYNTAIAGSGSTSVTPGYYYWTGSVWTRLATGGSSLTSAWLLGGNTGTNPATNFVGTTDNQPLIFKTNNDLSGKIDPIYYNVFLGPGAGINSGTSTNNAFFGFKSGYANNSGIENSFFGSESGVNNQTGNSNAFFGKGAGRYNSTGSFNSFFGNSEIGRAHV